MADIRTNIAGLQMKNPVMTASGTFGYGIEFADLVNLEEIGGIIVKGTTLLVWAYSLIPVLQPPF